MGAILSSAIKLIKVSGNNSVVNSEYLVLSYNTNKVISLSAAQVIQLQSAQFDQLPGALLVTLIKNDIIISSTAVQSVNIGIAAQPHEHMVCSAVGPNGEIESWLHDSYLPEQKTISSALLIDLAGSILTIRQLETSFRSAIVWLLTKNFRHKKLVVILDASAAFSAAGLVQSLSWLVGQTEASPYLSQIDVQICLVVDKPGWESWSEGVIARIRQAEHDFRGGLSYRLKVGMDDDGQEIEFIDFMYRNYMLTSFFENISAFSSSVTDQQYIGPYRLGYIRGIMQSLADSGNMVSNIEARMIYTASSQMIIN